MRPLDMVVQFSDKQLPLCTWLLLLGKDIPKVIWTAADKMKSCGAYTSYWYDSTKRKAIALGRASPNDLAKAAYAEARELWDKHNP
jgi:hypothetical protein